MTTNLLLEAACCLALSVGVYAMAGLQRDASPSTASPAPDRCCAATERRLRSQPVPAIAREAKLVRDVYRFVGSHLDLMTQLPCFCGCDAMGHGSVADCFVERRHDPRRATWSSHGAGCGMCIGIARDAMVLHGKNSTSAEIRRHVETRYGASRTPRQGSFP